MSPQRVNVEPSHVPLGKPLARSHAEHCALIRFPIILEPERKCTQRTAQRRRQERTRERAN